MPHTVQVEGGKAYTAMRVYYIASGSPTDNLQEGGVVQWATQDAAKPGFGVQVTVYSGGDVAGIINADPSDNDNTVDQWIDIAPQTYLGMLDSVLTGGAITAPDPVDLVSGEFHIVAGAAGTKLGRVIDSAAGAGEKVRIMLGITT